jgi:hypothetical protein
LISTSSEDISIESFEEEKLVLKCIIYAFPPPKIQWFRNNSTINEGKNATIIKSEIYSITTKSDKICTTVTTLEILNIYNYSLIFNNYSCVATNIVGKSSKTFYIEGKNFVQY